jgi:rSAM/selenodomain-associated transferase 1
VKTRLASELGAESALAIYRGLGERVMAAVATIPSCAIVVAYTPDGSHDVIREWLGSSPKLRPQSNGDLGERMSAAITDALAEGAQRVVVIGTDCPGLTAATVVDAFSRLDTADLVLGPATDGGYYLIGMTRAHAQLFERIPWSSDQALSATLTRAKRLGLRIALLDEMHDVDTADDWERWKCGQ